MSTEHPFSTAASDQPVMQPPPAQPTNWKLIGCIAALAVIPIMLVCGGILIALLLPAVQAGREAARRMSCSNNLKQIALGLHNYHSVYGSLPPAYTVDDQGQPLHSWRTLILPFVEQQALYDRIDLSKPWDDPVNQTFAETSVPIYQCPSSEVVGADTTYVAVIDPAGMMSGPTETRFRDATDGLSLTLMLTETHPDHAVPWMSPNDIDLQVFQAAAQSGSSRHAGGANAVFGDGSVKFLSDSMDPSLRQSIVTKDAGESIVLP